MALDKATVARIAKLSRIKVADEDLEPMAAELSNILGWIEQLNELDTDAVPAMTSIVEVTLPMREDTVTDGGYRDKILANAPERTEDFFTVPKVLE